MRLRTLIRTSLLAGVVALSWATIASAQTTGQISGTVTDSQGKVVPGVAVSATSPQVQGARTAMTDSTGQYRLPTLPPGVYSIKAELSGFQTSEQGGVSVSLEKTSVVDFKLAVGGVTATETVTAEAPQVNTTTASGGVTVSEQMFSNLPVQRNFYGLTRLAPGVTSDAVGPTALGSSGAENQYLIDGLNVTGVVAGEERKEVNFDLIQEVNVMTQGLPAEYGRMTGTMVQAITKSGGNTFHGGIFGYGNGAATTANDNTAAKRPTWTTTVDNVGHAWDSGGTLGGFIVKDKLWFFAAYDGIKEQDNTQIIRTLSAPGSPAVGSSVPLNKTAQTYSGKITYSVASNQTLVGSVVGDPTTSNGAIFTVAGPASTWQGTQKTGGTDGSLTYNGVFANTWLAEASYGRHNEKTIYSGAGTQTPLMIDATQSPNGLSGGFGYYQDQNPRRDEAKASLTKYLGHMTIKGGIDFEKKSSPVGTHNGGDGQRIYKFAAADGTIYYRHRYYVNDLAPGYVRSDPSTWVIANPLSSDPVDDDTALYLQDSIKLASNVTVDAGVRWERQRMFGRDASKPAIDLKKNWAPRLNVVIDPMNDGKSKIYAAYDRYYEDIPMDINIRAFGGEVQCFCYNFSPNASDLVRRTRTRPRSRACLAERRAGQPEPEEPVHRRVPRRVLARSRAESDDRRAVQLPQARPRHRRLPRHRPGQLLHCQSG